MRAFRIWALSYCMLLLAALGVAAWAPQAFQKANTSLPAAQGIPDLTSHAPLDISDVISRIPYRGGEVWAVEPSRKYQATIGEGRGNCASKTLGLAYHLGQSEIDFQIIDLIHPATFLNGYGHTLLRVAYRHEGQTMVGLVDMLEGGLPLGADGYLDVADLARGPIPDVRIDPLHERKDDEARYFGEFLDGVILAYRSAAEVNEYHDFVETFFVPLGNERLEKYVYDGLSLLFGKLPSLYVGSYDRLVDGVGPTIYLYRSALWVQRSAFVILPILLLIGWRLRRSNMLGLP